MARPTAYKPEYARQARKLCLLGATDKELADFFEVSEVTINAWKKKHPAFLKSLKAGKDVADARVADKLYHRALGYKHKAVKIMAVARGNNGGSEIEEVPYVEHYPPDTTAAIFWLKNRRPEQWRDRQNVDVTSNGQTMSSLVADAFLAPQKRADDQLPVSAIH